MSVRYITRYTGRLAAAAWGTALVAAVMVLATACGGSGASLDGGDTIEMRHAAYLTMVDHGDFVSAEFRNPWDTTRVLQTYYLVPREAEVPAGLPDGCVIRVPLQKSVVYTSVHCSLVDELGHKGDIAGVCDARYIMNPAIRSLVADGAIADCGNSMAPNIERIMMLNPDAILLSAYENSNDHNKVDQMGIPIIDCIDYMETSPLGRAEWMRFFGRLYGEGAKADSLFLETERAYNSIKAQTAQVTDRPVVLTEMIYGGNWDVPAGLSTAGVMIEDAGGRNPFGNYARSGSVRLSPESVLYQAGDADIWLIKYPGATAPTLESLGAENDVYRQIKAFRQGNVYGCGTELTTYFDDAAFHPHWVLSEYADLFHPGLVTGTDNHHYWQKLEGGAR